MTLKFTRQRRETVVRVFNPAYIAAAIPANQSLCDAVPIRQQAETPCRLQDRCPRVLGVRAQSTSRHQFPTGISSIVAPRTLFLRRATALAASTADVGDMRRYRITHAESRLQTLHEGRQLKATHWGKQTLPVSVYPIIAKRHKQL